MLISDSHAAIHSAPQRVKGLLNAVLTFAARPAAGAEGPLARLLRSRCPSVPRVWAAAVARVQATVPANYESAVQRVAHGVVKAVRALAYVCATKTALALVRGVRVCGVRGAPAHAVMLLRNNSILHGWGRLLSSLAGGYDIVRVLAECAGVSDLWASAAAGFVAGLPCALVV